MLMQMLNILMPDSYLPLLSCINPPLQKSPFNFCHMNTPYLHTLRLAYDISLASPYTLILLIFQGST